MAITAKPEVLPPHKGKGAAAFSDENLDHLSHLLDDFLRIPGTPIRFGLDGIVGFIPGIGDILGGLASSIIILAACVRGVEKATIARMLLNIAIETGIGSLPVVGDAFDIWFRANRRNYALMTRSIAEPGRHARTSWLFLGCVALVLLVLILLPILLAAWLLAHLAQWLGMSLV
jgi:hypothetical protein